MSIPNGKTAGGRPVPDNAFILSRLEIPAGRLEMVLDTDTYNEIDDQFALVYALKSPERLHVQAVYAAPFTNARAAGPAEGMERSHEEILRVLGRMNVAAEGLVFRGSTRYLGPAESPCASEAAADLIRRAGAAEGPLYVVAIGAITNIASAILLEPGIIRKIVVVWLGGHALHWPHTREFNLAQDVAAARVVLDCGVPLVHVPCENVVSRLITTVPEIERYVEPKGEIGRYLAQIFKAYHADHVGWSKEIWDMAAVAHLIDPGWVPAEVVHSPVLTDQLTWSVDRRRHLIKSASFVHRDAILRDFIGKL